MFFKKKENIEYKVKKKKLIFRIIILLIALFITAVYYNLFLVPNDLVVGGSGGIAIILNHLFNINNSASIFIIALLSFILSYIFLGKEKTSSVVISTFIYPMFVSLTSDLGNYIDVSLSSNLLIAVIAGMLSGFTSGLILKASFSNSGISTICLILSQKLKKSYGNINFIVNSSIVILGGFIFDLEKVIYAVIYLAIDSYVTNKIVLGNSNSKAFYIVTDKEKQVSKYIMKVLNHGVTTIDAKSAKSGKEKNMILCVMPTSKYFILKEGIKEMDKNAFFLITDAYEMYGGTVKKIINIEDGG